LHRKRLQEKPDRSGLASGWPDRANFRQLCDSLLLCSFLKYKCIVCSLMYQGNIYVIFIY
jgi:hypothetical protein